MRFIAIFIYSFLSFSKIALASPLPCTILQTKVKAHSVKPYRNKSGTLITKGETEEHCRFKNPKGEKWQTQFFDGAIPGWPLKEETFKSWTQEEKEIVLRIMSEQPNLFRDLENVKFLRGTRSRYRNNPGAAVKKVDAIALYDIFFQSKEKSQIISHELSHLYIYKIEQDKILRLLESMGWENDERTNKPSKSNKVPLLKTDSSEGFAEDLANHFEIYLHKPKLLKNKNVKAFDTFRDVMGTNFKLENQ
jgi:hypothetical protein